VSPEGADVLEYFKGRTDEIMLATQRFVELETPSMDIPAIEEFIAILDAHVSAMTPGRGQVLRSGSENRPHLRFDYGERVDVLLVGHFDTVHAKGTLEQYPFRVEGDRAYGPGILDMKSGIAIMAEVASYILERKPGANLSLLFNSDEEIASQTSSELLCDAAKGAQLVIVVEFTDPSGLIKVGLRGHRRYNVTVKGKGGHAAYPEVNKNPVDAIADIIVQLRAVHRPESGSVVVPTVIKASDKFNVVPEFASVTFDVRMSKEDDFEEVDKRMHRLHLDDPAFEINVHNDGTHAVFEANYEGYPWKTTQKAAAMLGRNVVGVEGRGASDANHIAPVNKNVIEAFGGWGDGAHSAEREYVLVSSLHKQAALMALMTEMALNDASPA
jgi:glutamate carboxypeptidase